MTTVLLLGGSGLLGGHLQIRLQADPSLRVVLPPARGEQSVGDLTDKKNLFSLLETESPDIVVNLVAATSVDECEKSPDWAYRLNAGLPSALSDWQARSPKTWVIQVSTDMVYDRPGENPEDEIHPLNIYALTKRAGELAIRGNRSVILRTNFFGPSLRPGRTSFTDWLHLSFKQKSPIKLFRDVEFSPLHVETLSSEILRVIKAPHAGLFNLGSRDGLSKADFALSFAKLLHHSVESHAELIDSHQANLNARRPRGMKMKVTLYEKIYQTELPTLQNEILLCRSQYAPL